MMQYLEIAGTLVGLLYLYFEYKASIWLWATSIVMPAIYIFVYWDSGFYADMGINVYYLIASIYGWIKWLGKRNGESLPLPISHVPRKRIVPLTAVTTACFFAIAAILINFTDSSVPWGDSFTTALSIAGLWMLVQKWLEQWLVWIIVDAVSAALYFYKGLDPTAWLYLLYTVVAVAGYFKWKKMMHNETESLPDA